MIISSILDTDLYKLTQMQAVLELFHDTHVTYKFTNRGKHRFNQEFLQALNNEIGSMGNYVQLTDQEYKYMKSLRFIKPGYLEYLRNYRFKPEEVSASLTEDNDLDITISGPWHSTILWEVPLMALISELYFTIVDTDWNFDRKEYSNMTKDKAWDISHSFAEFGTRRRRTKVIQSLVCESIKDSSFCVGTSNVYFAMLNGMKPIGTAAHEWTMGISAIHGLRHANRYAMECWSKVYRGDLGIVLTDTYGTEDFFQKFDMYYAKLFDGVRHDSGCPIKFATDVVNHYKKLNINPIGKTIIFSDGLDVETCQTINDHCEGLGINWSFGIGTNFTNDKQYFGSDSLPLNMVIKLRTCDGVDVVKLSDDIGKATGDEDAVKIALKTFKDMPL